MSHPFVGMFGSQPLCNPLHAHASSVHCRSHTSATWSLGNSAEGIATSWVSSDTSGSGATVATRSCDASWQIQSRQFWYCATTCATTLHLRRGDSWLETGVGKAARSTRAPRSQSAQWVGWAAVHVRRHTRNTESMIRSTTTSVGAAQYLYSIGGALLQPLTRQRQGPYPLACPPPSLPPRTTHRTR